MQNLTPDDCKTILTALAIARDTLTHHTIPALGMNAVARKECVDELERIDDLRPKVMDLRYSSPAQEDDYEAGLIREMRRTSEHNSQGSKVKGN